EYDEFVQNLFLIFCLSEVMRIQPRKLAFGTPALSEIGNGKFWDRNEQ
ncbi:hypothetical protein D046_4478B, partial [Vibrio parahaemolyticus V-223/04]